MTKTLDKLPPFLIDLMNSPPPAGSGVNQWLFEVARNLHAHWSPDEIQTFLRDKTAGCGRRVPSREIERAVRNSQSGAWMPTKGRVSPSAVKPIQTKPEWPKANRGEIQKLAREIPNALDTLTESSPVEISTENHDPESILARLFPGNPLLCVSRGVKDVLTARRKTLPKLSSYSHLVPSLMSKPQGTTQDGKPSARCIDNTGPRCYLVTEFDGGTFDEQAATILHLAKIAPLVMVVHSAGKSLHAWWHCIGKSEGTIRKFMEYAVSLGADKATWPKCQLVRLPLGWREDKGKVQEVLFFDYNEAEFVKGGRNE